MIDLGRPALYAEGVTLFPDHADPALFHVLPAAPRLARRELPDGSGTRPDLMLLKYRLDPSLHGVLGAGLLALTVELGVDEERLARLRRRAARQAGRDRVTLAPVAAEGGTCELILIDRASRDEPPAAPAGAATPPPPGRPSGSGLVERILGAATPALYGTNAAVFQAVLSAEGVALVEGALAGGGLPAGVIYGLRTTGLRPALRAEIVAHWRQVYEFFEARLHGGQLLAAVDVGPTMEDLVQREAIRIEIDELVPAGERTAVFERALETAQRYVLEKFFQPTLGATPPPEDPEADDDPLATIGKTVKDVLGLFTIQHSLRAIDRDELKTFRYRLHAAQAETLTLAPQGTLAVLLPEDERDGLVVAVEPAASAEMRFDVGAAVDLAAHGVDHLEVELAYGERKERKVLDAASPRAEAIFWFEPARGNEVRVAWEAHLAAGAEGLSGVLAAPPFATASRVVRLDPRELYDERTIRVVAQGLPFDRYPRAVVDLELSEPAAGRWSEETVELLPDRPEAAVAWRSARGAAVRARRRIRWFAADGSEVVDDWEPVEGAFVVAGDPLPETVDVLILGSARFGTAVARLIVELRPVADPARVGTRLLTAAEPSASWGFQPPRDAPPETARAYEYRLTVDTTRGTLHEGPWQPGPPGKLVVGEGGALRQVEVLFVGATPAQLGLLALKLRLAYADEESGLAVEDEFLIEDAKKPVRWAYPAAAPDRRAYTLQLTLIHRDGRLDERPPVTTDALLALVPLTA